LPLLVVQIVDSGGVGAGGLQNSSQGTLDLAVNAVGHMPGPRVKVERDIAADLPDVTVDPDRIVQVLVNLLSNAMKFSPAGASVRVAARAERGGILCSVSDRGPGMTAEERDRLFQPFVQLAGGAKVGGTGLGLVITRHIMEQHGGTITVASTPGKGSEFSIWIP